MKKSGRSRGLDPVLLELSRHLFASVAEEMGTVLQRSSFSPNIKERRDYSCGVFDSKGRAVALGDHMPVHLGSMPATVSRVLADCPPGPGDVVAVNDPFAGGTHLPDITLVSAYPSDAKRARFYLASRAHHSDVGGSQPGSMPAGAEEIFAEGIILPPVRLVRGGEPDGELMKVLLANVRTPREREADLRAQMAANLTGARRLGELETQEGPERLQFWAAEQIRYTARILRAFLRRIPDGTYQAEEWMDGDGLSARPVRLQVTVRIRKGKVVVDFEGTDPQCAGNINAVESITRSAVYYVFRCLVEEDIPYNSGCFESLDVRVPPGSMLSARRPAAVAGGNVETSQRVVDVVLRALARALPSRIPAQSSGTMNNLTLGGATGAGEVFTYYETIGGGMGASSAGPGWSGVHTHMTNSLNTPIEALEQNYPVEVRQYRIRRGSGGKGRHQGGDGILREIRLWEGGRVGILAERQEHAPSGCHGGQPGRPGRVWHRSQDGRRRRGPKETWELEAGDSVVVETPGGGGWGRPRRSGGKPLKPEAAG